MVIQGFLEHDETDKVRDYLTQYLEQTDRFTVTKVCGNPVVNMLVCHYMDLAKENDITFEPQIHIPDTLIIQNTDLSVLLGNLLENAFEAAAGASGEHRDIRLKIACPGKMLMIAAENGFNGVVRQDGERYLSTKHNHRGLGLKSIAQIAQKYDGNVEFVHNDMVFHTSIMLRNC